MEQPVNWQEFLSFKDKYENSTKKARNRIYPAKLPIKIERKIKNISRDIFEKFRLSGVVRIDFIVKDEKVFVNEINSIPGSLAFYLFEKQSLSFSDVLNKLIEFATLKNKDKNKLTFVYDSKVLTKLKNL